MPNDYLTTVEVADYLRLKERKVYDLVRQGHIPCSRATGKLLFPRQHIDMWVLSHLEGDQAQRQPPPPVLAGSQDPLLEWAVRESGSDLASLCQGSGDGVRRLLESRAMLAGIHLLDAASGRYNEPAALGLGGVRDLIVLHWASRRQGLLLVGKQYRVSNSNAKRGQLVFGNIQDDGNAPHVTTGQSHVPNHRVHVGLPHEPCQRREESVSDINALPGDLLTYGQCGQIINHPRRILWRGQPLDQGTAMRGKGVIDQVPPLPGCNNLRTE